MSDRGRGGPGGGSKGKSRYFRDKFVVVCLHVMLSFIYLKATDQVEIAVIIAVLGQIIM